MQSLLLELRFGETVLSTATGFVVSVEKVNLLITARHVMTGRHADSDIPLSPYAGIPDNIVIYHNGANKDDRGVDTVVKVSERLIGDDQSSRWIEHPELGPKADIAALPLTYSNKIHFASIDVAEPENPISCRPSEMVCIVGYPVGSFQPGSHAIWATGFIASEMDFPWQGKPVFLVDSRTRSGQSGSPVYAYRIGPYLRADNTVSIAKPPGAAASNFLGVYSGRIHKDSDIGIVWKRSVVLELINHAAKILNA